MTFQITWLGTAGFLINSGTHYILIDPYFTRVPLHKLLWGSVLPDQQAISAHPVKTDAILITHSHIDHLLDAPIIALQQQIPVYGTPSTARLLQASLLPVNLTRKVRPGDEFSVGDIQVKVFPATHMPIPGFHSRTNLPALHTPLKTNDYQMDFPLAYRVTIGNTTFLTDPGDPPAGVDSVDLLSLSPYHPPAQLNRMLKLLQPKTIIPSHWDVFWQPLSQPLRAMLPWRYRPGDPHCAFIKKIRAILPDCQIIEPKIFQFIKLPLG
jgi:L-ascorbate metabolism protein UlaG (beta-lactamase superfamily)